LHARRAGYHTGAIAKLSIENRKKKRRVGQLSDTDRIAPEHLDRDDRKIIWSPMNANNLFLKEGGLP
jgi:hypothetical protein